jgi:transposase-like protein
MLAYGTKIKEKAVALRKKGKSFSQIAETLDIGKSTVGFWFKNVMTKSKTKTPAPKKPTQKKPIKAKSKNSKKKK